MDRGPTYLTAMSEGTRDAFDVCTNVECRNTPPSPVFRGLRILGSQRCIVMWCSNFKWTVYTAYGKADYTGIDDALQNVRNHRSINNVLPACIQRWWWLDDSLVAYLQQEKCPHLISLRFLRAYHSDNQRTQTLFPAPWTNNPALSLGYQLYCYCHANASESWVSVHHLGLSYAANLLRVHTLECSHGLLQKVEHLKPKSTQ